MAKEHRAEMKPSLKSLGTALVIPLTGILLFTGALASYGPESIEQPAERETAPARRVASFPSNPIPSGFDVGQFLTSVPLPESSAYEPSGNFRLICGYSHLANDDPIVYPGQPGRSHLHMFFGNREADANSTYKSLRQSGDSSCQGGPINRSAYWMPALFDGNGEVVIPEFISVYYKGPGHSINGDRVDVVELAPGLQMIAGAKPSDPDAPSRHQWYCEFSQNKARTIPNCSPNELVGVVLPFPSCWNGVTIDSGDHRSHLAYISYENGSALCPRTHPISIPEFTLGAWFEHDGNSANWHLSSDRVPGMPRHANGSSFHSDWLGAWDPDIMTTWTDRCINGLLNCSGGDLGNGTALSN